MGFILLVATATLICTLDQAGGFPTGPGEAACHTLSPDPTAHGPSVEIGISPWQVNLSALNDGSGNFIYSPGESYLSKFIHRSLMN